MQKEGACRIIVEGRFESGAFVGGGFDQVEERCQSPSFNNKKPLPLSSSGSSLNNIPGEPDRYPRNPLNFASLEAYPGNTVCKFEVPRCLVAISPKTSRKSVVRARSRPSLS